MRVVLDSNVLVSALLGQGAPRRLLLRLLDSHMFVSSVEVLAEVVEVLLRDKFGFAQSQVDEYVSLLASGAQIVDVGVPPRVVDVDPDDDFVLATAALGHADYIATGDRHLLNLGGFSGIRIVTVRGMIAILEDGHS